MAELARKQKEKAEADKAAGKTRKKKKKEVVEIEVITIEYEGEWATVCSFSHSKLFSIVALHSKCARALAFFFVAVCPFSKLV
jgi:transcriptional antiterminator Rof (Rho-off)